MFSTFLRELWDQTLTREGPVSDMQCFRHQPRPLHAVLWNVSAWLRKELQCNTVGYGTWTEHTSISMTITGRSPMNICDHVLNLLRRSEFTNDVYTAADDTLYHQAKAEITSGSFRFHCTVTCYICAEDATVVSLRLERRPERGALNELLPQWRSPANTGMDVA